jgi:hypothetical protein
MAKRCRALRTVTLFAGCASPATALTVTQRTVAV